ncbi:LysE family transporter [Mesorhizobium sp. M0915]|uniref:LysE family translocator n=1 Tax=Mesorhizobium sp. M0915 TaxID=2957027 RepID=UPI003338E3B3
MSNSLLPSTAMLQFLAAYTVIMITPGPIGLATGSLASLHGFGRTIPLVAGIGAGTAVLAVLVAFGAVHLSGSLSVPAVKIAGAAVLGWMALRIARTAPPAAGDEPQRRQAGLFAGGFLISILSPETATFFCRRLHGADAADPEFERDADGRGHRRHHRHRLVRISGRRPFASGRARCRDAASSGHLPLAMLALVSAASAFPLG